MIGFLISLAIILTAFLAGYFMFRNAPMGYEDEAGFYEGEPTDRDGAIGG